MSVRKSSKFGRLRAVLASFLVLMGIFAGVSGSLIAGTNVYAVPGDNSSENVTIDSDAGNEESGSNNSNNDNTSSNQSEAETKKKNGDSCKDSLGALGWLVCPATGAIAKGVDALYGLIEDFLTIDPIPAEDGSPVYEIWKYCRGLTNIIFIIFLLVVIYSQITGFGISNYGIKKSLPKLIVAAILVNLSFLICLLAIDVSNIVGHSLRGLFESISQSAVTNGSTGMTASVSDVYGSLAGGTALAVGGTAIAFEVGAIWMLIPIALGAIVAVASGLITIALRQAVVILLLMVSPLAIVANILPNTEKWFKKWKELLLKMLMFYPAFSLLFGAANLAGFAIIMSAKSGFGVLLGIAVQIFPLFFSWSLMKMSGTFLGDINSRIRGMAAKPLAANRGWADSHRLNTQKRRLAAERPKSPSIRLMQVVADRRIGREEDINQNVAHARQRALAARASKNWTGKGAMGAPTKRGESEYARIARGLEYQRIIERDNNTMNRGLGDYAKAGTAQKARLDRLDNRMVMASDLLKVEQARGEKIEYENALGFHKRMEAAINAHTDSEYGFDTINGEKRAKEKYKFHINPDVLRQSSDMAKYNAMHQIMEGNESDIHYAAAIAAQGYDTQRKMYESKMQKYFELAPPTQDVVNRLSEITKAPKAANNIDAIVAGMRILNQRGDTDLVKKQLDNVLDKDLGGGIQLGTHASQALASFLMFEVKDNDPTLRRFGKYINLETARSYNSNDRKEEYVTYDEYIRGSHVEPDGSIMYAKKDAKKLLEGTSLDNIERTALSNLDDSLKKAFGYDSNNKTKEWDVSGYLKRREEIQTAFEPAFLSSSLKWLSGSEQINSGVKFWTGYELKQKKDDDGNVIIGADGNPEYDLSPVWKEEEFIGHEDEVERYYRRKTNDYFKDQTTGQILNMRTDYREATMEHLLATYLDDDSDGEDPMLKKQEYNNAYAEIQARYANEPLAKAKKKREKDIKELKMELAGRQLRKILGESGKLKQIYRTRSSGTAINAKDWLRKWVNLDNEDLLRQEMNYYDEKRRAKIRQNAEADFADDAETMERIYDADTREIFLNDLQTLKDEMSDKTPKEFFDETKKQLVQWFGKETVMVKKYDSYYHNDDPNADSIELYKYLRELLSDPDNYPDA